MILLGRALFVLSAAASATTTAGLSHQEVESALTERYQTTVPQPVRQALGLLKRDRIRYTVRAKGEVVLQRVSAEPADDDPALAPFLALLEQDIASHPEGLQPVTAELASRLQDLVSGIDVDLEVPLPDDESARYPAG